MQFGSLIIKLGNVMTFTEVKRTWTVSIPSFRTKRLILHDLKKKLKFFQFVPKTNSPWIKHQTMDEAMDGQVKGGVRVETTVE